MDNITSATLPSSMILTYSPEIDPRLEDLLQLEAMRRYSDELKNIQRQVEEHSRSWVDNKLEYLNLFKHLCDIMKQVGLRQALDTKLTPVDTNNAEETVASMSAVRTFFTSDRRPIQVNDLHLQETVEELRVRHKPRHELVKQMRALAQINEIQKSNAEMAESIKKLMEALIQQVMDQCVVELSRAAG